MGANRLTTRNRGFTVLGRGSHWDRQLLAEKTLPQKSSAALAVFETFLGEYQMDKGALFDYSVVEFSMLLLAGAQQKLEYLFF